VFKAAVQIISAILFCLCGKIFSDARAEPRRVTERTIPRFVSLKRSKTNVRFGPGTQYPVRWVYQRQGLPLEIVSEFGNWRRIRASDGSDGWVHAALLSTRRTALAAPWDKISIQLRAEPGDRAAVLARLEPRVLVDLKHCDRIWCAVSVPGKNLWGYVRQVKLWGVYPDETI